MLKQLTVTAITLIFLCTLSALALDNMPPSVKPPKGMDPKTVPQFVSIGFDDNTCSTGVVWACNLLRDKKNKASSSNNPKTFDNAPVRVSFFFIGVWPNSTYSMAEQDGHEIANHTLTHHEAINDDEHFIPLPSWENDIIWCNDTIKKFCPKSTCLGFRTPRLEYEAATFSALTKLKFIYDCSVEHTGSAPVWPYTLDDGADQSAKQRIPVPKTPGFWEIPVHDIGTTTGFDYNFFNAGNVSSYASQLKSDLDKRYNGNRCPLIINAHTEYYSEEWPKENPNIKWNSSIEQRRTALQGVIEYALGKPDVRFVRMIDIINWMRDPVALNATTISESSPFTQPTATILQATPTAITVSTPIAGNYTISLHLPSGKLVRKIAPGYYTQGTTITSFGDRPLRTGLYLVRLTAETTGQTVTSRVMVVSQ
ncbi:MAG: polysaccharide deacetylase family protein [Chitinivibrionales bacterium]|nr:polysaccharide deacetylase family protein [Chitinivibrionales bacterium]